jgi:Domain of unknown function (DUF3846)
MFAAFILTPAEHKVRCARKFIMRPGFPSLKDMQDIVGGYIETGFRMQSKFRKDVTIDFYVNEEGLMMSGLPIFQYAFDDEVYQLAGSGVFTGTDSEGESIELLNEELDQVLDSVTIQHIGWTG